MTVPDIFGEERELSLSQDDDTSQLVTFRET